MILVNQVSAVNNNTITRNINSTICLPGIIEDSSANGILLT